MTEILETPPDTIGDGTTTVSIAGTRVQLSTTSTGCKKVLISAKQGNTGDMWIGGSTVAANRGKRLVPMQDVWIAIDNLNKVYVDAATGGDGVEYVYIV